MIEQITFESNDFANNPESRCPCLLILDISGSMQGEPIRQLNEGLKAFYEDLSKDNLAMKRVEVGIVTFGPVNKEMDFTSASSFIPPILETKGDTPMGQAINEGINMLAKRKQEYKSNGISYYKPWVFLITDGSPTDEWHSAANKIKEGEASKAFSFFAIGVQGANMNILRQISVKEPIMLNNLNFREMFSWLSASLSSVSRSSVGDKVELSSPLGWGSV